MTIYHQTAVKGLNLAKATEDQLCDLSQYELVEAVLAYRKDYEYKQQECKKLRDGTFAIIQQRNKAEDRVDELIDKVNYLRSVIERLQ